MWLVADHEVVEMDGCDVAAVGF